VRTRWFEIFGWKPDCFHHHATQVKRTAFICGPSADASPRRSCGGLAYQHGGKAGAVRDLCRVRRGFGGPGSRPSVEQCVLISRAFWRLRARLRPK
jgi:hypothetical protein